MCPVLKAVTVVYRSTIESILSGRITTWYSHTTADRKALQKAVRSAERTIGCSLPVLQDTYNARCHRKAKKIIRDLSNQPGLPVSIIQTWAVQEHHG
jgi:hypothetical protein